MDIMTIVKPPPEVVNMSGSNEEMQFKPLTRLGRRKKNRYWSKYIDTIMADGNARTSSRIHAEMLTYVKNKCKEEGRAYSGKNLPSVRQVAAHLTYSEKYSKERLPNKGLKYKCEWRIIDDV